MPGQLKVAGVFCLSARRCVVVYGDIVEGTLRRGDVLQVPTSSRLVVTSVVHSLEAVDGTPTGSHAALVLESEDQERPTSSKDCTFRETSLKSQLT
jgi:hypothetical protein